MLIMGRWDAWGGSKGDLELERKSNLSSFGNLPSIMLVYLTFN